MPWNQELEANECEKSHRIGEIRRIVFWFKGLGSPKWQSQDKLEIPDDSIGGVGRDETSTLASIDRSSVHRRCARRISSTDTAVVSCRRAHSNDEQLDRRRPAGRDPGRSVARGSGGECAGQVERFLDRAS